ncbi:hypothetical protein BZG01_02460 [Labilibaculum manganireducens]|uniref:Lipocalin-like domain-containing protein n=1 Tax=Labilibaculum manganireducens TaxID=1940525 RepID=A0A2N3IFY6_9BACT|nr:hypothetical protein [Labilibaculum manganireducens]PKQ69188.1 hypothetical protein BZG01_02460 [Labilibaculum manganireducens]
MNTSFYNKLSFAILIAGSLFLTSCGSSSGGGEEDVFEFKSSDLTNKYWYSSTFIDDSYSKNDIVLVYKFNGGGDLYKQEFSGRRDVKVGSWSLGDDNTLIIDDETIINSQEWKIDKSSTRDHIFLKSTIGNRDFYTQINELNDVTADASIVKEVYLKNDDFVSGYRYDFEVKGDNIKSAVAKISSNESFTLIKSQNSNDETVWRINEVDANKYLENFPGEKLVKFVLTMNSGEEYKLEEKIYNMDIAALNYQSVKSEHNTGTGPLALSVEWKAIADPNVYYYVQILNSEKDENNPLFTSNWQPASTDDLQLLTVQEDIAGDFGLALGEQFYVKLVAFLFEEGINPFQGDIQDFNIQARSQFIRSGGEW